MPQAVIHDAASAALLAAATVIAPPPAAAQQPGDLVFEADVALMEVEVRVTARGSRPVPDLTRDDFELFENNLRQEIRTFEFVPRPGIPEPGPAGSAPAGPSPLESLSPRDRLRRSTFVYIASEGRRQDRIHIHRAATEFVDENVRPGVLVSIDGSPFTSEKADLHARLEEMLRAREGANFVDTVAADLARDFEFSSNVSAATEDLQDLDGLNGMFQSSVEEIADRAELYRRLRMYKYIDLVRALSAFPGRKVVVLFSTGLPIDEDNVDLIKALESDATRARVRFFVSDVNRLSASAPGGDAGFSLPANAVGQGVARLLFDARTEERQSGQDGLREMARRTGGRAVLNSNDLGEVFEVVERETGSYYLLGYYPQDTGKQGRLRRLKVRVRDPSLKVSHQRGYYEERSFTTMSQSEKDLHLHQALTSDTPYPDLPLACDHEIFRNSAGEQVLVYSVGLRSSDLPSVREAQSEQIELTVLAQAILAHESDQRYSPIIDERRIRMRVRTDEMSRLRANRASWLHLGSQLTLDPGTYDWRVIVRDNLSGLLGSYSAKVKVPKPAAGVNSSTLLLTGRIEDVGGNRNGRRRKGRAENVLVVDGSRFYATAIKAFERGSSIYLLYDVYDLDSETAANPPSPSLALYRGRQPLGRLPLKAFQTVPQPQSKRVRYLGALQSDGLAAGTYTLAALLPEGRRAVIRRFEVIEADSGLE